MSSVLEVMTSISDVVVESRDLEPTSRFKTFIHKGEIGGLSPKKVILTGDLNLDEAEWDDFVATHPGLQLQRDAEVVGIPTWGGNHKCREWTGGPQSGPQVLDYTFVANGQHISSHVLDVGYRDTEFNANAGSDHSIIMSKVDL